jgi:peptidoglycan hydrolase-like protein with peptidoglycan-binding domain
MKTTLRPVLVVGIIFGFVLMLMNVSVASAQQQAASPQKNMTTQSQPMQSSQPGNKMQTNTAKNEKSPSSLMKSTGKAPMMSSQEVKSVQEALNKDGYKLTVDGVMGNHTRSALKNFQKKNDLKVTGKPDSQTLAKLDIK